MDSMFGTYKPLPAPKPVKKPDHNWYDGITGFIGHLGDDVVNSVVGIPMGITMLIKHPVDSVEMMGKVTWHDWSPLFHGDVREWAHNFYEHPLAPILDVASVFTAGAGLAGRAGVAAAELGMVSKTGKIAMLSDPARASAELHFLEAGGEAGGEVAAKKAIKALERDPRAGRVVLSEGGIPAFKAYHPNPLIRARQKGLASLGEKAAQSSRLEPLGVDRFIGNAAFAKRWTNMDSSTRGTAAAVMQSRELGSLRKLGQALAGMTAIEKFNHIEDTMREGLEHQAHRIREGEVNLKGLRKERYIFIKAPEHIDPEALHKWLEVDDFEGALKNWGTVQTTKKLKEAMKVNGEYLAVKGKDAHRMATEAGNASKAALLFYKYPTQVWKYMVLAASPRYFVNNVVGNTLMLAMSANPVIMSRAVLNHLISVHGIEKGRREWEKGASVADVAKAKAVQGVTGRGWHDRIYAGEHQGWAMSESGWKNRKGALEKARGGLYPVTHKFSDTFHRNVAMNFSIMRTPEYQIAYGQLKRGGMSHIKAHQKAAEMASESARVRSYVRDQVNHTLGQYHNFNKFEKSIKTIVPFYAWDRAITRHTAEMVKNRPYQAAMIAAIGQRGHEATHDMLGNLPDFLEGVIPAKAISAGSGPLGLLGMVAGQDKGRQGIIMTQGLNPYATVGDLVHSGESLVGLGKGPSLGESLGGSINPILKGAVETLTGTSLTTGSPVQKQPLGLFGGIYMSQFRGLPMNKVIEEIARKMGEFGGYEKPKDPAHPFLFKKDTRAAVSSWLGLPTRQVDAGKSQEIYNRQNDIKKSDTNSSRILPTTLGSRFKDIPGL